MFWPMHFGVVGSFVKWKKKLQSIKAWAHKAVGNEALQMLLKEMFLEMFLAY